MTNKERFKRAVCVVLAAFGVIYLVESCQPVNGSAYDLPTGTTHIDSATLVSWLGNTLDAQYLGADGEYHKTTATYSQVQYINGAFIEGLSASDYNGRSVAWYLVPYPYDSQTAYSFSPVCLVNFNLHLQDVTYVDFGFAFHMSNKSQNISYSSCQPYSYLDYYYGSRNTLYAGEGTGAYDGHLGTFSIVGSNLYGGNIQKLEGASSDFYLGDVSACCCGNYNGQLYAGIAILDLIVNDDYIKAENAPPPSGGGGDTPSGASSGTLSGTIGDSPVDITVEIEQEFPDYFYSGGEPPVYDDKGYSAELAPVIDEADNAYEVVQDGLEVLSEMPFLPSWNYLDSILSLVPAFKALMIAGFILALYGWKIYR